MILRQVRKHGHIVIAAMHPSLVKGMRRHFHGRKLHALVDHLFKRALQDERLRRRIRRRVRTGADFDPDRADQPRFFAGLSRDLVNDMSRRRFSVCARHAN